ncbi:MAG: 30S ribosomal protein S19e [Candidatus Altiarchaeales archaeon WOR_SM1_79]|nr:MAG: 30S ribosomal protein S19e [Candidatus Altiarchaeales archaeon WOR_SM1_79]
MATAYDAPADELIEAVAEDLKHNVRLKRPQWARFVKTGVNKDRCPENPDWWWTRAASVLRKVCVNGPVGVSRLKVAYGSRKNRGHKPEKFQKGAGKIIRSILQEFDDLGFTEKVAGKDRKCGRKITPKGQSYLDKIAGRMSSES